MLQAQIERENHINAAMFEAIDVAKHAGNLDEAYKHLLSRFGDDHSLYWFYRGGNHIAVHVRSMQRRVAIIAA